MPSLQSDNVCNVQRHTLGDATVATAFDLTPRIRTLLIKAETGALRIAWRGVEGKAITDQYWVLPAAQAVRVPCTPASAEIQRNSTIYVAGDSTSGAVVAFQMEAGELPSAE